MPQIHPVELLKRQYLQLLAPEQLTIPTKEMLRLPKIQTQMYRSMLDEREVTYLPPARYRFRVLKRLMNALEKAIKDPEEDEISDDISGCLARCMSEPLSSSSETAQQKSYITYTAPTMSLRAPQITLLEAPSLLASSGTTGFRTWEAALFLGAFLATDGNRFVAHRNVVELGAGTGFLSIFCAKHLGVQRMLATDGSLEVVNDLKTNLHLNNLDRSGVIQAGVLQWGHTLINGVADCREAHMVYDLAIGADVTYDINSIPSLIATMRDLFELYPKLQIMICATVRNKETLELFTIACSKNGFTSNKLDVPTTAVDKQTGFFHPAVTPIDIYLISRGRPATDPFEV